MWPHLQHKPHLDFGEIFQRPFLQFKIRFFPYHKPHPDFEVFRCSNSVKITYFPSKLSIKDSKISYKFCVISHFLYWHPSGHMTITCRQYHLWLFFFYLYLFGLICRKFIQETTWSIIILYYIYKDTLRTKCEIIRLFLLRLFRPTMHHESYGKMAVDFKHSKVVYVCFLYKSHWNTVQLWLRSDK